MSGVDVLMYCFFRTMGITISWKHVTDLYHRDSGKCHATPGLSLLPKLKYEHIHLTSFSKMRVDLAAQFSNLDVPCI